jgi:uncharacterized membrane protein
MSNSNELILAGLKYGVIPFLAISSILIYLVKRRNPDISKRKLILWLIITFVVCNILTIIVVMFLFIILMSGILF